MSDFERAPQDSQEDEEDILFGGNRRFDAAIASSDWTTETVIGQLRKGNIFLDPSFQRRQAWQDPRKSRYIESLILGIPTPQIILAERQEKRGTYIVIDGKQRLLTLRQFSAEPGDPNYRPFRLSGLKARPDLNGMSFDDLRQNLFEDATSALDNATIRSVIIKSWPNETFLYEVFLRINSGSVQLSPQELRQALHPGPFTDFLNNYVIENQTIRDALGLSEPDFRMRDNELVLRFIAFWNFMDGYRGNLKEILDAATNVFNKNWVNFETELKETLENLELSIKQCFSVFERKDAFRKWNGDKFERQFNRAIFDIQAFYFMDANVAGAARARKLEVINAFKLLCEEPDFSAAVSGTTKSIDAVRIRYTRWGEVLSDLLDIEIPVPVVAA